MHEQPKQKLQGISGWLILVALGVIAAPCWFVVYILSFYSEFFSEGYWTLLTRSNSEYYMAGFAVFIGWLLGISCFRMAAGFYAIYLFFNKKKLFPVLFFWLLVSLVVLNISEAWFVYHFLRSKPELNWLCGSVGALVIWTVYITRSERVKNTFTESCHARQVVLRVLSLFIILFSGFSGYFYGINDEQAANLTVLKHTLSEIAGEINRIAPDMLDSEIRFDSVQAHGLTLEYHYSLVEYEKRYMDVKKFSSVMIPRVIREDCQNKNIVVLMEQGAILSHTYFDLNGERLAEVEVNRERCREARLSRGVPM